jgi:stage III sporulation protein AA
MLEFLPERFLRAITFVNQKYLYEIRMRVGQPTMIRYGESYEYLSDRGRSQRSSEALIADRDEIEETVLAAGKYSVYSVEDQLRQGFLTAENGERIGIAGRYVFENGRAQTVRDYTSLCIRIPHAILGCGEEIFKRCFTHGLINLLIASPPGQGKTTILRDLSRLISAQVGRQVLICDERGEIGCQNVGESTDVFSFADKQAAMGMGIRVMRPDVIVTDELTVNDLPYVHRAKNSGVKVIASIHAESIEEIDQDCRSLFDKTVLLDKKKIGRIDKIYEGNIR